MNRNVTRNNSTNITIVRNFSNIVGALPDHLSNSSLGNFSNIVGALPGHLSNSSLGNFSHYDVFTSNFSGNGSLSNDTFDYYTYEDSQMCLDRGTGSAEHWTLEAIAPLLHLLILLSNSLIVVAVLRQWAREGRPLGSRATAAFLVLNLAVADAILGLFLIFQWLYYMVCAFYEVMSANDFTCILPTVLVQFADSASAITVIIIALDRVMSVTHAVRYRNILTPRRTIEIICVIWILALFISLTIFMIPGAYSISRSQFGIQCLADSTYEHVLLWGTVTVLFSVLIGCYWTIHRVTLLMLRRGSNPTQRNMVGTKAARMLLIVIAWDSCAYIPFLVVTFLQLAGVNVSLFLVNMVRNLTLLTFLADSYIYAYGNPHTKKAITDLIRCLRCQSPLDMDTPGHRDSLAETSTNMIRRMMSSLTASSVASDGDKTSPTARRNSLRLT